MPSTKTVEMSHLSDLPEEEQLPELPPLTADAKTDLTILTHFVLLFSKLLPNMRPEDLLSRMPEASLASGSGSIYESATTILAKCTNKQAHSLRIKLSKMEVGDRLREMRELADESVSTPRMREMLTGADGRVVGGARLRPGARDGSNVCYVWVRGLDGCCSDRVWVSGGDGKIVRSGELLDIAERLEGTGVGLKKAARADRAAATWIRERVGKARVREDRVRKEVEKRERKRRRQGKIVMDGEVVDVQACGRGRRERKSVCYEEVFEESEDDGGEDEFTLGDGSVSYESDGGSVYSGDSHSSRLEIVGPTRGGSRDGAERSPRLKRTRRSLRHME